MRHIDQCAVVVLAVAAIACGDDGTNPPEIPGQFCPKGDQSALDLRKLVGEDLTRARELAHAHKCIIRVVIRDGKDLAITDDLRPDRINVVTRGQRISRVRGVF